MKLLRATRQFRWMGTAGASAYHPFRRFASEFSIAEVDPKRTERQRGAVAEIKDTLAEIYWNHDVSRWTISRLIG